MGSYEREQELIAKGEAQRGQAALDYFAELDAQCDELTLKRRPDYSKTLFAVENDDIYREFCEFVDQPEPRFFDKVANPISINGHTAADVYETMLSNNFKLRGLDAAAVYNMMVKLRDDPVIAEKLLAFRPRCDKAGAC